MSFSNPTRLLQWEHVHFEMPPVVSMPGAAGRQANRVGTVVQLVSESVSCSIDTAGGFQAAILYHSTQIALA